MSATSSHRQFICHSIVLLYKYTCVLWFPHELQLAFPIYNNPATNRVKSFDQFSNKSQLVYPILTLLPCWNKFLLNFPFGSCIYVYFKNSRSISPNKVYVYDHLIWHYIDCWINRFHYISIHCFIAYFRILWWHSI